MVQPVLPEGHVNHHGEQVHRERCPRGGAIFVANGLAEIGSSTFSDNTASSFGGAIFTFTRWTVVEIKDSTLSGNFAKQEGGAIDNNFAALKITNSTLSGNSTNGIGGAVYNWGGNLEITNSTLTANRADADGDGDGNGGALYDDGDATYLFDNTIVAGNLVGRPDSDSPNEFYVWDGGAILDPDSCSHNLIGDAATAGGLIDGVNGNIVGNGGTGTIDITTVLDPTWPTTADRPRPMPSWRAVWPLMLAITARRSTRKETRSSTTSGARVLPASSTATVDIGAFEDQTLFVKIDVKPGSDPNSINLASNGVITVAIFTTDDFDASLVNASTVVFAEASAVHWALENVDGDGDLDMVLHFRVQDTNLAKTYAQLLAEDINKDGVLHSNRQTAAVSLTGQTAANEYFEGFDDVDLFLSGKRLREFLEDLMAAGVI